MTTPIKVPTPQPQPATGRRLPVTLAAAVCWLYALGLAGESLLSLARLPGTFAALGLLFAMAFCSAGIALFKERPYGGWLALIVTLAWTATGLRGLAAAVLMLILLAWAFLKRSTHDGGA